VVPGLHEIAAVAPRQRVPPQTCLDAAPARQPHPAQPQRHREHQGNRQQRDERAGGAVGQSKAHQPRPGEQHVASTDDQPSRWQRIGRRLAQRQRSRDRHRRGQRHQQQRPARTQDGEQEDGLDRQQRHDKEAGDRDHPGNCVPLGEQDLSPLTFRRRGPRQAQTHQRDGEQDAEPAHGDQREQATCGQQTDGVSGEATSTSTFCFPGDDVRCDCAGPRHGKNLLRFPVHDCLRRVPVSR